MPPAAWREVCDVLEDPIRFLQEECPELIDEFEERAAGAEPPAPTMA